jgi:mannose-1-phosphate guanylyltransferase/phosphomannomutase
LKAVVLAGGKGTRLRPLTYTKPKPLLPLAGEPAILRLVRKLACEGIDDIIVTTNYFAKLLRTTLGDGSGCGIRIHHVEERTPLGTAGSVKNSESLIDETFAVIQGDNQFEFRIDEIVEAHRKLGAMATMALVRVENPSEYGIVELSDGRVTRFLEKPSPQECFSDLINAGIYVIEPDALELIPAGKPFDFSRDLFPRMIKSGIVLAGSPVGGFWVDVGDPRSYLKANFWALDNTEPKGANTSDDAARALDNVISDAATLRGPVHLGKNVRIHKDAVVGPYACIGDRSEISAGAKIVSSVVYEDTQIGTSAILDTCIVAEKCKIGARVQIQGNSVVGAGTELGEHSQLTAESRVGPFSVLEPRSVLQKTVTSLTDNLERACEFLEKSHLGIGLTAEEAKVCGALCELGEADANAVARFANVPYPAARSALTRLQERGIAASFGNAPKVYALARKQVVGA